jgi:hypothetical protein
VPRPSDEPSQTVTDFAWDALQFVSMFLVALLLEEVRRRHAEKRHRPGDENP